MNNMWGHQYHHPYYYNYRSDAYHHPYNRPNNDNNYYGVPHHHDHQPIMQSSSSSSLQLTPLPHDFRCPSCQHQLEKGTLVNFTGFHQQNQNGAICDVRDSITVVCPSCNECSVQCCHCPTTCAKDAKHKQLHKQSKYLHSRKYSLHYQEKHSLNTDDLPSGNNDDENNCDDNHSYDDDMMDAFSGNNDDDCQLSSDDNNDDQQQHQYEVPTLANDVVAEGTSLWLPSDIGQEVTYNDFVNMSFTHNDDALVMDTSQLLPFMRHIKIVFRDNPVTCRYFLQDIRCCGQAGIKSVVHRAKEGSLNLPGLATSEETTSLLLLTKLFANLSTKDRAYLAKYLAGVVDMLLPIIQPRETIPKTIPKSPTQSWSVVFGSDKSVYGQIPREIIQEVDKHHVLLSINDLINTQMAFGADLNFIVGENGRDRTGINGTPQAEEVLARLKRKVLANGGNPDDTLFGLIVIWSDGFITAWVRQKDNSCWTLTFTLCPTDGIKQEDSHAIALGLSKYDHSNTVEEIIKQLEPLEDGVERLWSSDGQLRIKNTSFGVFAWTADKPEKAVQAKILDHAGNNSKRCLFAARWSTEWVPSCRDCSTELVRRALNQASPNLGDIPCDQCCGWCYDSNRAAWKKAWPLTCDKFPSTPLDATLMQEVGVHWPENREVPFEQDYIKPMEQTFSWLLAGVKIALLALATRTWKTKGETTAYLNLFAINTKLLKGVIAYGDELYKSIVRPARNEQADWINNLKEKLTTENLLQQNIIPKMWDQDLLPLRGFIEMPMHQLFLGLVQTIYEVIEEYIKSKKEWEMFIGVINPYLSDINGFRLSWCRVESLPKSSWISENYIGFMRCLPWIVGVYSQISKGDQFGCLSLVRLVHSLDVMISALMCADEKTDVKRLELCVKMFLNACVNFSQHLEKKKRRRKNQSSPLKDAEPFYVKGNFISLLNLPTQLQRCGRLGGLWDGDLERNIQGVKPSLSHLRKNSSFLHTKLTGIRQDKYFDLIWRKWFESNDQSDSIERNWFIGTYRVPNRNEVHDRINRGNVLPCLQLSTGLCIPFGKSKGEINVVEVSVDNSANGLQLAGQVYRQLIVGQTSTITHEEVKNADCFGVLLPHLSTDDEALFDQRWTIITNDRLSFGLDSDSFGAPWYYEEIFRDVIPPSTLNRSLVGHKIGMVCRYEEVNSNDEIVGVGLQYYSGEIITFNGRGRFGIVWQSATEESTETSVELLTLNNYGTFKERGWVIL